MRSEKGELHRAMTWLVYTIISLLGGRVAVSAWIHFSLIR
jgi:hypothetical protein